MGNINVRINSIITNMSNNNIITSISNIDSATATDLTVASKKLYDANINYKKAYDAFLKKYPLPSKRSLSPMIGFIPRPMPILAIQLAHNDINNDINIIYKNINILETDIQTLNDLMKKSDTNKDNINVMKNGIKEKITTITKLLTELTKKINVTYLGKIEKITQDKLTNNDYSNNSDSNTKYLWMFLLLLLLLMIILYKYKYNKK